ncbi:MAG: 4Fe-4S binding protein [Spirochaetota bacterium]|nr:4Fe-4S binding protein [Spirochaetota bacterium]
MNINTIKLVYFSPTKTTQKVVESIAQSIGVEAVEQFNLTSPESITIEFDEMKDELVIIGAPVYAGRIPIDAVKRLQRLKGNNTPAVIVVVYGNREYEDALVELKDIAIELGFKPIAGGAFIGEHSFANEITPIAKGRPDSKDLEKAGEFGRIIKKKTESIQTLNDLPQLQVTGNHPYKERAKLPKVSPVTLESLCVKCKKCITVCPTAAITLDDVITTNSGVCILCCACVKNCATNARVMEEPQIIKIAEWLNKNFRERKEPEFFITY